MSLSLSVLDLVPVRTDQRTSDAVRASLSLARTADELGYTRYWVAEHHNMPAVAATSPPVLLGLIGSATERIRIGSGGVMLPNHAPLVVAEQFALLEAAFPGRVDLGIGRAPGSDQVTSYLLRGGSDDVSHFPEFVQNVIAMMRPAGAGLDLGERTYEVHATPSATEAPPVWLLGSSDYSARLAAQLGLPYVFAHHFSGAGTAEALELYRSTFRPSPLLEAPRTFLTANVAVADTAEQAADLVRPQQLQMVALRTGGQLSAQQLVDDAVQVALPPQHQALADSMLSRWIVGTPSQAAARITELAEQFDVDEVMVHPIAGTRAGTPADQAPERERTLRELSAALG